MKILENIQEKLKPKYKEKDESLKKNIKDSLGPIISYFGYKKVLDDEKTPEYMKKGIQDLIDMTEKGCYKSLGEIEKILNEK